jgi:hypothetical protein
MKLRLLILFFFIISSSVFASTSALNLVNTNDVTIKTTGNGNWGDIATWNLGRLPQAGDRVQIQTGHELLVNGVFDESLMSIRLDGALKFSTSVNSQLRVDTLVSTMNSHFEMGSEVAPIPANISAKLIIDNYLDRGLNQTDTTGFVLNNTNLNNYDPTLVGTGALFMGSVRYHGAIKTHGGTLAVEPSINDTSLSLDFSPSGWNVGDEVVIAGTTHDALGDEKRTITAIAGTLITLDAPLSKNHHTPPHSKVDLELKVHVINTTRNIGIESDTADRAPTELITYTVATDTNEITFEDIELYQRRGHVMYMNPDVDIRFAQFSGLGRTNKRGVVSDPEVNENLEIIGGIEGEQGRNTRARYPMHFHRNRHQASSYVEGASIVNGPGWGYVNHSSKVDFFQNVAYNIGGSSFVTESGDELGSFIENISIRNTADTDINRIKLRFQARIDLDEFAFGGHGFWYQGIAVISRDNVASGAGREAFVAYPLPLNDTVGIKYADLPYEDKNETFRDYIGSDEDIDIRSTYMLELNRDIAYGSNIGLMVGEHQIPSGRKSQFDNFLGWSLKMGVSFNYSNSMGFNNITLIGDTLNPYGLGTYAHHGTSHIDIIDGHIEGFAIGYQTPRPGNIAGHLGDFKHGRIIRPYSNNVIDFHHIATRLHDSWIVDIVEPVHGTLSTDAVTKGLANLKLIDGDDDLDIDSSNVTSNGFSEIIYDVDNDIINKQTQFYIARTDYVNAVHVLNLTLPQIIRVHQADGSKALYFNKTRTVADFIPFPSSTFVDKVNYDSDVDIVFSNLTETRDAAVKNSNIPEQIIDKTNAEIAQYYRDNAKTLELDGNDDAHLVQLASSEERFGTTNIYVENHFPLWAASYSGNLLPNDYATDPRFYVPEGSVNVIAMKLDGLREFKAFFDRQHGQNLLADSAADNGLNQWVKSPADTPNITIDTSVFHSTNASSFKFSNIDNSSLTIKQNDILLPPGTRSVNLSAWSKGDNVLDRDSEDSSHPYTDYRIRLKATFADGTSQSYVNDYFKTGTSDWHQTTAKMGARREQTDIVSVSVIIELAATGTAWFDDIKLVATGVDSWGAFENSQQPLFDDVQKTLYTPSQPNAPELYQHPSNLLTLGANYANFNSLYFDGRIDSISAPMPFSLAYRPFGWQSNIRPLDVTSGTLFEFDSNGSGIKIYLDEGLVKATFSSAEGVQQTLSSSTILQNGHWYNLAFAYDYALGKTFLYINGVKEAQAAVASIKVDTSGTYVAGLTYRGMLDDIQIIGVNKPDYEVARFYSAYEIATKDMTSLDMDADGVVDISDAFPLDPTETTDTDGDGIGDNSDEFPTIPALDSDGDTIHDENDAFPFDPTEWSDLDKDGIGDNSDTDRDGDGVNNSEDDFPQDASEYQDSDGDGVGDNEDVFPSDINEWFDSDRDGVGDNADTFPNNANETTDSDGDGWGDNQDLFPESITYNIQSNIVSNGGAEDGLAGWIISGDNNDDAVLASSADVNSGTNAFELLTPTNTSGTLKLQSDVVLQANIKQALITAWGKANAIDNRPRFHNLVTFSDTSTNYRSMDLTTSNSWDRYSIEVTSTIDISNINVSIQMTKQAGAHYFADDIQVYTVIPNDNDNDGIDDSIDPDDDNDLILDGDDLYPLDTTEYIDSDGDGIGNNADPDDDNDTINDINDAFTLNAAASLDTDNDGLPDSFNVGCDTTCIENSGLSLDLDDDNDKLPDDYEIAYGLDPLDAKTANEDADLDGFTNYEEFIAGSDPTNPQSYPGEEPNTPPVAENVSVFAAENWVALVQLNATDADGDVLTYAIDTGPMNGTLRYENLTTGVIIYQSAAGYVGMDSFSYTATDGVSISNVATVTITVSAEIPANQPPIADAQSIIVIENNAVQFTLTGSDPDGDNLQFVPLAQPVNGEIMSFDANTGKGIYQPNAEYVGIDSFEFVSWDGKLASTPVTVSIMVESEETPNQPPVAEDLSVNVIMNNSMIIQLQASDADNQPLTFSITSQPSFGTLIEEGVNPGVVIYQPNTDYVGQDSFIYTASDGIDASDPAIVSINVSAETPVNEPPVADTQTITTVENTAIQFTLTGSDPEGQSLLFSPLAQPNNGTITDFYPETGIGIYQPNSDYSGNDSFEFISWDGELSSNVATVSIVIQEELINSPPIASDVAHNGITNAVTVIHLNATDKDGQVLTYAITSLPSNGSIMSEDLATGRVVYQPNDNYIGSDSFTYIATDGIDSSNTATVTISIAAEIPENQVPIAYAQIIRVHENSMVEFTLTGSDPDGDSLRFAPLAQPINGTITEFDSNNGVGIYQPNTEYFGDDSFEFVAWDGELASLAKIISISVHEFIGPNQPPVAQDIAFDGRKNTEILIELQASDEDNQALSFSITSQPSEGALIQEETGSAVVIYQPNTDYVGLDSFFYTVDDGIHTSNAAVVSLTISTDSVSNTPPNLSLSQTQKGDQVIIDITVSDIDNDPITLEAKVNDEVYLIADNQIIIDYEKFEKSGSTIVDVTVSASDTVFEVEQTTYVIIPPKETKLSLGGSLGTLSILMLLFFIFIRKVQYRRFLSNCFLSIKMKHHE